jgi:hypothetical protein
MSNKINTTIDGLEFVNDSGRRVVIRTNHGAESDQYIDLPSTGGTISTGGGADGNDLVKVSSNDTTAGYLNGKLVAGTNITLTEGSDGGNETLTIAASGGGGTSYVTTLQPTLTDVENTTTEGALYSVTVPSGELLDNQGIIVHYGYTTQNSTGGIQYNVYRLMVNGTQHASYTTSTGSETYRHETFIFWRYGDDLVLRGINSSNNVAMYAAGNLNSNFGAINIAAQAYHKFSVAGGTVNWSDPLTLEFRVQLGTADPSYFVRSAFAHVFKG